MKGGDKLWESYNGKNPTANSGYKMNWNGLELLDNPYYQDDAVLIYHADCRAILPLLSGIDAIITDPPYELGFMGKEWDKSGIAYDPKVWLGMLEALKPGGHLLSFGGTRTYHQMVCAIEDAGFEIRDMISWIYGQGFPKSLDVSKAIDKMAGEYVKGKVLPSSRTTGASGTGIATTFREKTATNPQTDEAQQWEGWGTALKPAHEPIVLARKPLEKGLTVAENVLRWGTGAINIDGCRIGTDELKDKIYRNKGDNLSWGGTYGKGTVIGNQQGRFPANLLHDGSEEVLAEFAKAGVNKSHPMGGKGQYKGGSFGGGGTDGLYHGDTGSAARFFYCAKASRAERDAGLEGITYGEPQRWNKAGEWTNDTTPARNTHPTIKPLALMRYLIKLITPPNGIILDPFMGSGSTLVAARQLGFRAIGIDTEEKYCEIAQRRIEKVNLPLRED